MFREGGRPQYANSSTRPIANRTGSQRKDWQRKNFWREKTFGGKKLLAEILSEKTGGKKPAGKNCREKLVGGTRFELVTPAV